MSLYCALCSAGDENMRTGPTIELSCFHNGKCS